MRYRCFRDGEFLIEEAVHGDEMQVITSQPSRDSIMQHVQDIRQHDNPNHLSFGGLQCIIPLIDLHKLKQKYPELASYDNDERNLAWNTFFRSAESAPYRVRPRRELRTA